MSRLLAISLVALAGCGAPDMRSDWERAHEARLAPTEEKLALPAYPSARDLIEFSAGPTSSFRFFVDPASLSVGKDGVVRYALVARSSEGAETVTYEGIRCASRELRIYAVGSDGVWARKAGDWRRIAPVPSGHHVLFDEYFCPLNAPISSRGEGIDALRRGGHPFGRDPNDMPRGF